MADPEPLKLPRGGLGDNNPPEPIEPPKTIPEQLAADYAALVARFQELEGQLDAAPAEVATEEQFKPLSDLLKGCRELLATTEDRRKLENSEWRKRVQMVDAFFVNMADRLKVKRDKVKERTDAYLDEKKAREEKARKAAAAAKAAAAEEKRWDAIWADARAELAAYDRKVVEAAELAARARKEAAARRADHLKDRGRRLVKVEPYLEKRAERRRRDIAAAAAAAAKAAADERARLEAIGDERMALEAEDRRQEEARKRVEDAKAQNAADLTVAKTETAAARRQETKAGATADKLLAAEDEHAEAAEDLGGAADRLGKRAERAERHANAGPAALSRTRSEMGTTSSLGRAWKVISVDKNVVDLNLLRGYLHPDAVETAARGYMMAHRTDPGGPVLEGCVFEQVEEGSYR